MKRVLLFLAVAAVGGCVPGYHAKSVMVNEGGEELICEQQGWGYPGEFLAHRKYEWCILDAESKGFHFKESQESFKPPLKAHAPEQ